MAELQNCIHWSRTKINQQGYSEAEVGICRRLRKKQETYDLRCKWDVFIDQCVFFLQQRPTLDQSWHGSSFRFVLTDMHLGVNEMVPTPPCLVGAALLNFRRVSLRLPRQLRCARGAHPREDSQLLHQGLLKR